MNVVSNVAVEQLGGKTVNTKFGPKPTFSFQADGQWFSTGFKRHNLNTGDVVSFSYTAGQYGNEADPASIVKGAAGIAPAASPATGAGAPAPSVSRPAYSGGGKGVFPIPALDGQRSIVRQNALTNARELVSNVNIDGLCCGSGNPLPEDVVVAVVIRIAKAFERYTAGDMDLEEVEAEAEAAAPKKAKKAA